MKLSIRVKLFLMFLTANTLLVLAIFVANQVAFNTSFSRYVERQAKGQLTPVVEEIVDTYHGRGDLDWINPRSADWRNVVHTFAELKTTFTPQRPPPPPRRNDSLPPPVRPPKLLFKDAGGELLIGGRIVSDKVLWIALFEDEGSKGEEYGHRLVGYLGIDNASLVTASFDDMFANQQRQQFFLIALLAIVVTLVLAIPFSKYLVSPVLAIRNVTRTLTAGNFAVRLKPKNRDEVGELARDVNRLAQALEDNEQARRRWIADISHELRTPLAVLKAELEAALDGIVEADEAQLASYHDEVMRLSALVEDLHQLALSDCGALECRRVKCRLAPILRRVLSRHQSRLDELGFETRLECDEAIEVDCDEGRIIQLFDNLMQNTLRYTDAGEGHRARLRISVSDSTERLVIEWHDSAPAVDEASLERLFDPLYREEASRSRAHGGSGLGLAICRRIVESHGGELHARLSPLGGLAIIVSITKT